MLKIVFQIALIFFLGITACNPISQNGGLQEEKVKHLSFGDLEYAPEFEKTARDYQNYQQLKLLFDSLGYFESVGTHAAVVHTRIKLADLLRKTGNYLYGIRFLETNLTSKNEEITQSLKGQTFNGLAALYYELFMHHQDQKDYLDSCWLYAEKTLDIATQINAYELEVDALTHQGAVLLHHDDYLTASQLLNEAYQINIEQLTNPPLAIMANLSWAAYKTNDFETALRWIDQCYADAENTHNTVFMGIALDIAAQIYETQGNTEKLVEAKEQLRELQAKDHILLQSLMMKELVLKHEMNTYKQTILGLYQEKFYLIRLTFVFVFISIVLIIISLGIYKLLHQQKHIREKEHELALARQQEDTLKIKNAELELTAKEAEQKTMEAKLESQDQELVYQSLKQIYFSQLTATIKEKFGPFQRKLNRKKDQEQFEKTLDEVCREASHNPLAEFEQIFLQMHHGFYEKLLEISPQLSRSELQLCALLRMNLPSKEIASLLFLSLSTIDQKRHQIRKKLGLESNQSLNNFLINL
jgi:DNA-binding CsgD family transcriptional regulator